MGVKLAGLYTIDGHHVEFYHRYEPISDDEERWRFEQYLDIYVDHGLHASQYVNSDHQREDIRWVLRKWSHRWIRRAVGLEKILAQVESIESELEGMHGKE